MPRLWGPPWRAILSLTLVCLSLDISSISLARASDPSKNQLECSDALMTQDLPQWDQLFANARTKNAHQEAAWILLQVLVNRLETKPQTVAYLDFLSHYAQGLQPFSPSWRSRAKQWAGHLIWSQLPFFWRLFDDFWQHFKTPTYLKRARMWLTARNFTQRTGILQDAFFQEVLDRYFTRPGKARLAIYSGQKGRLLFPALLALILQINGSSPAEALYLDTYRYYPPDTFSAQAAAAAETDLEGKSIAVLVDENIVVDSLFLPQFNVKTTLYSTLDPLQISEVRAVESKAASFQGFRIGSPAEFDRALRASGSADVVVILAHGRPGDLYIGGHSLSRQIADLTPATLKSGATVIFLSCSLGEPDPDSPNDLSSAWIQFANRVLPQGLAIASTNAIGFYPPVPGEKALLHTAMIEGNQLLAEGMFGPLLPLMSYLVDQRLGRPKKLGLRIYNTKTSEIHYLETP